MALGTGATANLVCRRQLGTRNLLLGRKGFWQVSTHPAWARYKIGDSHLGEVRVDADISVGTARRRGLFTAFVLEADIPALLCRGALGVPGGRLDFPRNIPTLRRQGVVIPLN